MPWPVLRTKHQEMGEGPYTNPEKTKIGADVGVSPRAWEDKFGPHTLVRLFFNRIIKLARCREDGRC